MPEQFLYEQRALFSLLQKRLSEQSVSPAPAFQHGNGPQMIEVKYKSKEGKGTPMERGLDPWKWKSRFLFPESVGAMGGLL